MFGELRLVMFAEIIGINELMKHSKDRDADRATQLLEEAVHGGGGGCLFARDGVEQGGRYRRDEEAHAQSSYYHGYQDPDEGGTHVDTGELEHAEGDDKDADDRDGPD